MIKVYTNRKKNFLITIVSLAMVFVLFFGIYGISRIQLKALSKKEIKGNVEEKNWNKSDAFNINDYKKFVLTEGDDFTILTLTDIHYSNGGWYADLVWTREILHNKTNKEIKEMISLTNPDLIVVTGDLQTGSLNDKNYERFAKFIDSFNIPFTVTFGNHDAEHRADKAKLMNILQATKNCIIDVGPTNLGSIADPKDGGLGNTIVNLVRQDGSIFYTLFFMDSGDWQNSQSNLDAKKRGKHEYSSESVGFSDKKIEWYEWILKGLEAHNKSINKALKMPKSMLFMHIGNKIYDYGVILGSFMNQNYENNDIPFHTEAEWSAPKDKEAEKYYNELIKMFYNRLNGFEQFKLNEDILGEAINFEDDKLKLELATGYMVHINNDKFMKMLFQYGSTKNLVTGHNHCDGYEVEFAGLTLTSVVKTSSIYVDKEWDMGNRGGTEIKISTLNNAPKIVTKPIYTVMQNYQSIKYPR